MGIRALAEAEHGGVAEPELHHPPGGGEDLGAGGTGGGYGGGRAAKTEIAPDEVGTGEEIVRVLKTVIRRKPAGLRVAATVGMFGFEDARGAGAEADGDAAGAVARPRPRDDLFEAVLSETGQGEPVVAAVEAGERAGDRRVVETADHAAIGFERGVLESAAVEAGAAGGQGVEDGGGAVSERVNAGEGGQYQRRHDGRCFLIRRLDSRNPGAGRQGPASGAADCQR